MNIFFNILYSINSAKHYFLIVCNFFLYLNLKAFHILKESKYLYYTRLSVQVAYRLHRSELSSDIELSQTNFYSAKLSVS